ncbi:hypothetical protein O181_114819 [Austropuccinia psidii MF-1]|uniref:Uncharacterized protein n=1 Tax=Austropuccinia psidii MF-1 TaxID=1389203 RepID=A0A9Q3PV02_9BASI|nr:hypothetical protein [Austropuccinia psidii MF-1]
MFTHMSMSVWKIALPLLGASLGPSQPLLDNNYSSFSSVEWLLDGSVTCEKGTFEMVGDGKGGSGSTEILEVSLARGSINSQVDTPCGSASFQMYPINQNCSQCHFSRPRKRLCIPSTT